MSIPVYKNPAAPEEERVNDLLSRMTLDEKIAQIAMTRSLGDIVKMIEDGTFPKEGVSSSYINNSTDTEHINKIQKYALENTRLGIPLCIMGETLHGFMFPGATVFPQSVGMGATFDTELIAEAAKIMGEEAAAAGVRQVYAPNLDLSRDPRWGRVEENFGEDPYLTSRMGVAYIKALQSNRVASSPKHYVAHGSPEGGLNISPVHAGERELREVMLEPFAAAIKEGGVMSMMPAYSELDGVPVHASRFLLTELLRDELGFDGYTVSDFGAVSMLISTHRVAKNPLEAAKLTLWAGIDHEAGSRYCFGEEFKQAAHRGEIPIEQIDQAVRRTLRIKFRLGLFEDPFAKRERMANYRSPEKLALTRRAARESAVLLENNGILPLSEKNLTGKVAVIGPSADYARLGNYTAPGAEEYTVTLRAALSRRLGEQNIIYAKGSNIASTDEEMLNEAKLAASKAQVAILVLGDNSSFHGGVGWGDEGGTKNTVTCGEGFDSATLDLPPAQRKLLEEVAKTKTPVILVLECGRPMCIEREAELSAAVIYAWYPGEQGGEALCELIFGEFSPSGRLPISFPRTPGHVPCFYNHKPSARGYYKKPGSPENPGRDYVFDTSAPLYPFGYGLSYTTFEYSDLQVAVTGEYSAEVTVTVANTGEFAADEAVLVFLRRKTCPVTPFVRRLRAFKRISLAPGEKAELKFTLGEQDFSYIGLSMREELSGGDFAVMCDSLSCDFSL